MKIILVVPHDLVEIDREPLALEQVIPGQERRPVQSRNRKGIPPNVADMADESPHKGQPGKPDEEHSQKNSTQSSTSTFIV